MRRLGLKARALLVLAPSFILGLACTRLLYDLFFPTPWLGRPWLVWLVALLAAILGGVAWLWLQRRTQDWLAASVPFLPFYINLFPLLAAAEDPVVGRFLFAASVWLATYLAGSVAVSAQRRPWLALLWLWLGAAAVYLLTMPASVGRADTFEFQVVTPRLGIVHPTGYPLYLLLGNLFTRLIPAGSFAWRLNLITMLYGLAALTFVYLLGRQLVHRDAPALAGAAALALAPTFWSQAIEAEVYTLHLLLAAAALFLLARWLIDDPPVARWRWLLLPLLLGLGLTNHLTTVLLFPSALLALLWLRRAWSHGWSFWLGMALALALPLALYAYLPLRWTAVNGEPMGTARFVDWVVGGRFQGALQWDAWLRDPARYGVVGRLFLAEWGWAGLIWAALGWLLLLRRAPRPALLLLLAWLGFSFYSLNYYVPDLAVFLLPAQLLTAVAWGAAAAWFSRQGITADPLVNAAAAVALGLLFLAAAGRWSAVDRSQADSLTAWGQAVLALPLEHGAAILADSEKIAPLYYLQQAEGVRSDLDILVLPDEGSYRAELDARLAAGQAVYLARFLPGLEGVYHLRSLGPLLEVSQRALAEMPASATPTNLVFPFDIHLVGYEIQPTSPYDPAQTAVTLYWQAAAPTPASQYVYLRWINDAIQTPPHPRTGQHPAGNYYPTAAWRPGEIVPDFHQLPRPILAVAAPLQLEAALAPPFTAADDLSWQRVAAVTLPAADPALLPAASRQAIVGSIAVTGIDVPVQIRPQAPLPITISGIASSTTDLAHLQLTLQASPDLATTDSLTFVPFTIPFAWAETLETDLPDGVYQLVAAVAGAPALCQWLGPPQAGCVLAEITVSGVPLPADAVNFADLIALRQLQLTDTTLIPGGQLSLEIEWQALAPISQNYTVFVQVLDSSDRIVGQVDAWPLQGTFPTSQWTPGQIVSDPYVISLSPDLPPGPYRLQVGWYLLATLQRLPVLDANGVPVDNRYLVSGLEAE
ncbi:MAG: hypothetical protein Fur0021_07210 [Candidatus Promineifilaceae bacterium]